MASLETISIWAGVIGCLVAVMALPTVFQMFWGAPHLSILFQMDEGPHAEFRCIIHNAPVESGLLRALRVYRTEPDVSGLIEIHPADSAEVLQDAAAIFDGEMLTKRISVNDGAAFTAMHFSSYRQCMVIGDIHHEDSDDRPVPDGFYDIVVRLSYGGHTKSLCKRVVVRGDRAYAVDDSPALEVF